MRTKNRWNSRVATPAVRVRRPSAKQSAATRSAAYAIQIAAGGIHTYLSGQGTLNPTNRNGPLPVFDANGDTLTAARVGSSQQPLANEDGSILAQGFSLVDLEAGWETKHFRLAVDVRNLLDTPWRQAQFANASRLPWETEPVDDLHFTPGHPRTVMASVAAFF